MNNKFQISITVHHIPLLELSFSNICMLCILHSFQTAPKSSIEQMKLRTSRTASMQQITQSFRRIWVLNSISFPRGNEGESEWVFENERASDFQKAQPAGKSSHPSRQWQSQPRREGWMRRGLRVLCSPARRSAAGHRIQKESSPLLTLTLTPLCHELAKNKQKKTLAARTALRVIGGPIRKCVHRAAVAAGVRKWSGGNVGTKYLRWDTGQMMFQK